MKVETELKVQRGIMATCVCICITLGGWVFHSEKSKQFKSLDVERLNIVEADGTVKMIITNTERFPNGSEAVNNRVMNEKRKKRSGMLFYNEDGIEAGGFIYDGSKNNEGHSAGMSLTFDQYNGDQVMQLLTTDAQRGDKRVVRSGIAFNDRAEHETQDGAHAINKELEGIADKNERYAKYKEYQEKGLIGGAPRIMLGKTYENSNGLFLFGKDGSPRAKFYVDKNDQVKLEVLNKSGEVVQTWPSI